MSRQRRIGTAPEIALRRLLHREGYRYRVGWPVPGFRRRTIDIAFTRWRLAVFVDGCFWHACPIHGTAPSANARWWREKLARNVARDRDTDERLVAAGWTVLRLWEHERPEVAASAVASSLSRAGAPRPRSRSSKDVNA